MGSYQSRGFRVKILASVHLEVDRQVLSFMLYFQDICSQEVSKDSSSNRVQQITYHLTVMLYLYNNNNNDDRLTAFDPGQPG